MLAFQRHTCAGRAVLPEPVCKRPCQPSGSSPFTRRLARTRVGVYGVYGFEGHTHMADRSRQWGAGLDGAPEVADVMLVAPQGFRTVRDGENAYPAFDNRRRYAPEGADNALRTGARSRAPYIYFARVARTRVAVCGLYGFVRKFCGHVRLWRGPHATRLGHPYYSGNAERGKQRFFGNHPESESFSSDDAHPFTIASGHGIYVPDSPATRRRSIRSRSGDRPSGFSYTGRLWAAR